MTTRIPYPQDVTLVLFHKGCRDGFVSALMAWLNLRDRATYKAYYHNENPMEDFDLSQHHVLITDVSFSRELMDKMASTAQSLVVLDHHRTAEKELAGFKNAIFDMDRSGARMTWDWFNPGQDPTALVRYVEDYDLWRFRYPETKAICQALDTYPFKREVDGERVYNFEEWYQLVSACDFRGGQELIEMGNHIQRYQQTLIDNYARRAIEVTLAGQTFWAVQGPRELRNEIADALAERDPGFALIWAFKEESQIYTCSLRCAQDPENDVSGVAEHYGGGGHRTAAGFISEIPIPRLYQVIQKDST